MLDKEFFAPVLASYANSMTEYKSIEEEINFSIKGNSIDAAASKELKRIRNNIDSVDGKIKERLTKFLNSSANKKFIQEFFISKKDDRYTIPLNLPIKTKLPEVLLKPRQKVLLYL